MSGYKLKNATKLAVLILRHRITENSRNVNVTNKPLQATAQLW
jgi:hypothetical protein